LILGDGASAQTVAHVLESIGIETMQVTRKPSADRIQYQQITPLLFQHHFLVVNTTPVGQFPNVETKPNIPYEALTSKHLLFDLIYNPTETAFLAEGKKQGCMTQNGLGMLHLQAEKSWEIWNQA
jgi:shikimate dehydrogenase